ncbi:putative transmembrane protein [Gregarina niphandrodes]|uniref:Transmembrane protein n=1 Tax=Gregarina niphandrodes TaxID=110365 RepID=A0A023AYL1_GRENI|nr:putative transmembrane protein [Gregarina niphandrodes]EZG43528.1 putative transmembrane protein [Gregarina niphandrodes]|eukprot:XP_011133241.1 putative transmembrane protein [Gregarina niphandrodes]
MTVVTLGGWLIIPCLIALHLQDHIGNQQLALLPQRHCETVGPVSCSLAVVNVVFACLLSTSIYVMAGNFLGVEAPSGADFMLLKTHTIVRWMFLNVSVLGVFISAVLYGVGTVSFPASSIVWQKRSAVTDRDLTELRECIEAASAELEETREQERRRTASGTTLSGNTHHLETVLKDLQDQYDESANRKRIETDTSRILEGAGWVMGAVGVYRVISAALNIIYWRVPVGEFVTPIVHNVFELLKLPRFLPILNVNLIANVATVTYVVALISSSIQGFTKSVCHTLNATQIHWINCYTG